jgi:hypothetical protein
MTGGGGVAEEAGELEGGQKVELAMESDGKAGQLSVGAQSPARLHKAPSLELSFQCMDFQNAKVSTDYR